tara:strand:- start:195 stop:635 length:441 start_codon:yes stop_codon:yes gene_type:complete
MKRVGVVECLDIKHVRWFSTGTDKFWIPFTGTTEEVSVNPSYTHTSNYLLAPYAGQIVYMRFASENATAGNLALEMHLNASVTKTGGTVTTANWDNSNNGPIDGNHITDWYFKKDDAIFISANPTVNKQGCNGVIVFKYFANGFIR